MLATLGWVVQRLLLPPGIVVLLLVAAVLLALLKWRRLALASACLGCAIVGILSLQPVADLLLLPLENRYAPLDLEGFAAERSDVIVLLGGGVVPGAPDGEGSATLGASALVRAVHAAELARRLGLPVVASGGRVFPDPGAEAEADVAARLLVSLGVRSDRIVAEDQSRTTWENAQRVRDLVKPERVVLVTTAIHMPRAVACFQELGIEVVPAPTDYLVARRPRQARDWVPDGGALEGSLRAIHEHAGILSYRLLYGVRLASPSEN